MADDLQETNTNNNKSSANKITEKLVSAETNTTKYTESKNNDVQIQLSPTNQDLNALDDDSNNDIDNDIDNDNNNNNSNELQAEQQKDEFYTANAHRARRIYHVCVFSVSPIIYLWTAQAISDGIGISVPKILSFLILLAIILEGIRLKKGWIIFGMREYERDHISAQSWGTISALIVLLLAFPRTYSIAPVIITDSNGQSTGSEAFACFGQIAIPIIWSLGFGDPLLGELKKYVRAKTIKPWIMYLITNIVLSILWILCFLWCGTPWWLAIIMPPIAIIAEKPSLPHIDDNGLMLLVPLLFTLILEPWFPKECNQIFYQ